MNKTVCSILVLTAGLVLAGGCTTGKRPVWNGGAEECTLNASFPEDPTKTAVYGAESRDVNWSGCGAVSVWGEENNLFALAGGEDASGVSFSGSVSTGEIRYAMSPYDSTASVSDGVITARIPCTQTVSAGLFDPAAAVMVGTVEDASITFRHAPAYLKIIAPGDVTDLVEIVVETNDGAQLTGSAGFDAATGAFTGTVEGCRSVTVKPEGGKFTAGGIYCAAVVPGTYAGGLTVKYLYKDDSRHQLMEKIRTYSTVLTLEAGASGLLGAATAFDCVRIAKQLWSGGPYWATTNVGADTETACGEYFAWGYTEGCVRNSDSDGWVLASDRRTEKRFGAADFPYRDADAYQDAAEAEWGAGWSLPTDAQLNTLINRDFSGRCLAFFVTSGINGIRIEAQEEGYTHNSIFLPAAGYGYDTHIESRKGFGHYWSSVQCDRDGAHFLTFNYTIGNPSIGNNDKDRGFPVRAVRSLQ